MLLAFTIAAAFALSVYWSSGSDAVLYAIEGIGLCLFLFTLVDYFIMRFRVKNMERFLGHEENIVFSYPLDKIYSEKITDVVKKHEKYKDDMKTQHSEEIEFITKWIHDVKTPISAIRLMSESLSEKPAEQLEMQILHIEQSIKQILFHIKSKRFHEDYTIKRVEVKSIINQALKQFAVFFLYKKISLDISKTLWVALVGKKYLLI